MNSENVPLLQQAGCPQTCGHANLISCIPGTILSSRLQTSEREPAVILMCPSFRLAMQSLSYQCRLDPGVWRARAMIPWAVASPSTPSAAPRMLYIMACLGNSPVDPRGQPSSARITCSKGGTTHSRDSSPSSSSLLAISSAAHPLAK
jgi:hypothetical protein